MNSGIYTIRNKRNGKIYVGRSRNLHNRLRDHKTDLKENRHKNQYLQRAYNIESESFEFEILEFYPEEVLGDMETYWMNMTNSYNRHHGYNIDTNGNNGAKKLSPETREKIRQANLGKKQSEETKLKRSKSLIGKKKGYINSLETRKKISESLIGKKIPGRSDISKEVWKLVKNKMGVKNMTPEQREKTRVSLLNSRTQRKENALNSLKAVVIQFENGSIKSYPYAETVYKELGITPQTIKYVINNTNGYIKKYNCRIL